MKPFESVGIWFLPEAPDRKVAGTLSFSQDEPLELKLSGVFSEEWGRLTPHYKLIRGVINQSPYGKYVTLLRSFSKSLHLGMPGLTLKTFIRITHS